MGWSVSNRPTTIQAVVEDCIRETGCIRDDVRVGSFVTVEHRLVPTGETCQGTDIRSEKVLWSVVEKRVANEDASSFIGCTLIRQYKDGCVGWKDMCESVEPGYYNCPLTFLDKVPVVNLEWRKGVLLFHARRNAARTRTFAIGERVEVLGCSIPEITIVSVRPLHGVYQGKRYRLNRALLGQTLSVDDPVDFQSQQIAEQGQLSI